MFTVMRCQVVNKIYIKLTPSWHVIGNGEYYSTLYINYKLSYDF